MATHNSIMVAKDDTKVSKLMVFKGTQLASEQGIPGAPSAIESFYIDEPEPKTPIVAVAIGESILFYRNMKPYFKYTLPAMEVDEKEKEIWRKISVERTENQEMLIENLKLLDRNQLTRVSQKLLLLSAQDRHNFIMEHMDIPLQKYSTIVAMAALQRVSIDINPPSCLVLATEHGEIYILDTQGFGILYQARTCSYETTPSLMCVHGQYEADFRIVVATRNGAVHLLRKSWLEGKEIFKLNNPLAGLVLVPIDETIAVASMDKQLTCFSKKGKQLYTHTLEEIPICLIPICLSHLGLTIVCVSMVGGLVQLFIQKSIVDQFKMEESVMAMIFGHLGQEEYVLTLITESGNMFVKILKRNAKFDPTSGKISDKVTDVNGNRISLLEKPKKSSIFIEQTLREKLNAKATYGSFQVELWRLRHTAARATVEAINSAESMISGDVAHAPIKVAAEVCGAGPVFRLFLTIQNLSSYKVATNLRLLLHADRRHYKIAKSMAMLPAILPGTPLKVDFEVTAILSQENGLPPLTLTKDNSIVRIIITKLNQSKPLIAAIIAMPESEASLEG
ncbi:Bardet-Biedl syndrome 1 protein homolog isoform X2 [Episyrphus balteatus]|uniref:Bardet-Biedl syndrome 1 protein homolog isoform X2 n=1 Tax=Episyrphus balteatus TaxID=286459 RepID=UPI0024863CBF|nr:Bardet-Biedl syndrome 1 protein homolog isoform X2 [Episyrphus balteatus]